MAELAAYGKDVKDFSVNAVALNPDGSGHIDLSDPNYHPRLSLSASEVAQVVKGLTAPAGIVLWRAWAEREPLQDWANLQAASIDRISAMPTIKGYSIRLKDGDRFYGERAEFGMANPEKAGFPIYRQGDTRGLALWLRLGANFPLSQGSWYSVMQIHQAQGNGPPPFKLEARSGRLYMAISTSAQDIGGSSAVDVFSAPISVGRWMKIALQAYFSTDPTKGYVDLYGDLDGTGMKPLHKHYFPTLKYNSDGTVKPCFSTIGQYRAEGIGGDADTEYARWTLATDRQTAEGAAFAA
jgi:Polysaccharide lyase